MVCLLCTLRCFINSSIDYFTTLNCSVIVSYSLFLVNPTISAFSVFNFFSFFSNLNIGTDIRSFFLLIPHQYQDIWNCLTTSLYTLPPEAHDSCSKDTLLTHLRSPAVCKILHTPVPLPHTKKVCRMHFPDTIHFCINGFPTESPAYHQ